MLLSVRENIEAQQIRTKLALWAREPQPLLDLSLW